VCLIITLIGGMVVGGVIQNFEEVIQSVVSVAIFIPVVMDMGGNVGTQSTTVFARGLAWQHINIRCYGVYLRSSNWGNYGANSGICRRNDCLCLARYS